VDLESITAEHANKQAPFATLRKFMRPRAVKERCELCSLELTPQHQHLFEIATRQLVCACDPCAILFSDHKTARYHRVPRRIYHLTDFRMTDAQWDSLHIPINLAFFVQSTAAGKVVALYPSPAGTTESLLTLEAWQELVAENPILQGLEADVEALVVNRVGPVREYYRAPIDECYKLVGIIRTRWRGLSGGTEVWGEIQRFFSDLKERSSPAPRASHA
jgi:hypothetical protein